MEKLKIDIVPGFGDSSYLDGLKNRLEQEIPHCCVRVIMSVPDECADEEPDKVIERIEQAIFDKSGVKDEKRILIGSSYGGLLLLAAALNHSKIKIDEIQEELREKLVSVLKIILVDAPLRSDVDVEVADKFKGNFMKHYDNRETAAKKAEEALPYVDHSQIVTIGSTRDFLVTPDAKLLQGDFQNISIKSKEDLYKTLFPSDQSSIEPDKGQNFQLTYLSGHPIKFKLDEVVALVQWALQQDSHLGLAK